MANSIETDVPRRGTHIDVTGFRAMPQSTDRPEPSESIPRLRAQSGPATAPSQELTEPFDWVEHHFAVLSKAVELGSWEYKPPRRPSGLSSLSPVAMGWVRGAKTAVDMVKRPPPDFLIEDLIAVRASAVLFGEPGSGKSFVALDLALSVAAGTPWQGRPVSPGKAVYFAAEGGAGLGKRIEAWCLDRGVAPASLANRLIVVEDTVDLMSAEQAAALVSVCQHWQPDLVVFDTLSRSMAGGDENSVADVTRAMANVEAIHGVCEAAVVYVHHAGKGGDYRGSTGIKANVETMVEVTNKDGVVTARCRKQKDLLPFAPIGMELRQVASSCVLHPSTGSVPSLEWKVLCLLLTLDLISACGHPVDRTREAIQAGLASKSAVASVLKKLQDQGHAGTCGKTGKKFHYGITPLGAHVVLGATAS